MVSRHYHLGICLHKEPVPHKTEVPKYRLIVIAQKNRLRVAFLLPALIYQEIDKQKPAVARNKMQRILFRVKI
jgi:hypothetical protein